MAQQTWVYDAPTGVYKSHAMSSQLFEAAVEDSHWVQFATPVDGYGRKRGDTVTWTRIANITEPTTAVLSETDRIPEDTFTLSTRSVTVSELGRAIPYSSLSIDLSEFDLLSPVQKKLRQQMTLTLDTLAATAAKNGSQVRYAPTGLTSRNIATSGSFGAAATVNLNTWHLEEIRDYLYGTLFCPPYDGDDYVGVASYLACRGIKRDADWVEWHKYVGPSQKMTAEIGKWENIRLIETNHGNALTAGVGTGSVLGEAIIFGDDFLVVAEAMTPELRAAQPEDFGRSKAVAWYGILAFSAVWGDSGSAGQARSVYVGST